MTLTRTQPKTDAEQLRWVAADPTGATEFTIYLASGASDLVYHNPGTDEPCDVLPAGTCKAERSLLGGHAVYTAWAKAQRNEDAIWEVLETLHAERFPS